MQTKFDHLIAFVSDQAIDAVSVLFDQRFHINRVTLVGLDRHMRSAKNIGSVVKRRLGVNPEFVSLPSPHIPDQFCDAVKALLVRSEGRLAVNLNTEDAACACLTLQAATCAKTPVFAVETQYDRLVWLSEPERSLCPIEIEDKMRCLDLFEMQEFQFIGTASVDNYADKLACAQRLLKISIRDESMLLQFLPKTGLTPRLSPRFSELTKLLLDFSLIRPNVQGRLQFANFESLAFVRGAWLEYVVFDAVSSLAKHAGVIDSHRGLSVRNKSGLVCEFDIVFMLQNALHIIECKSGDSRGSKFLTHFEGITRVHGLRARKMLVSVDRLSDTLVATADGLGIACIHGPQLSELSARLSKWMHG